MIKFLDLEKTNALHGEEIVSAVERAVRSGWYLNGRENEKFEHDYADFIGVKHCIGCANGLDSLALIFHALIEQGRLHRGDEVIVPANTFIATILAITANGLVPALVEPDPLTLQIDPRRLEDALTERTAAVMIVHLYGRCAYTPEIGAFCNRHNLILLEDNAQAHGCKFEGKRTGSLGLAAGHSFYPGKNLGALGDGGAVTTDDQELASLIRTLANYGSSRKYVFPFAGRNSRLDEVQAAALGVKLKYLDQDNDLRKAVAKVLFDEFGIYPPEMSEKEGSRDSSLYVPYTQDLSANVFHLFPIFAEHRDELQKHLRENGVETLVHYPIPPHLQDCYKEEPWAKKKLPITEIMAKRELSLPISPVLTAEEARTVARLVKDFSGLSTSCRFRAEV